MPCLTADRIYDYLDEALAVPDRNEVERHLAGCAACRCALETRQRISVVAANLTDFEIPDDFTARVMKKVAAMPAYAPKKVKEGFLWAAAAVATIGSGFGLYALLSGQEALALLQKWGSAFGTYLQTAAGVAAKGLKLMTLSVKIIADVSGQALATLQSVAEMMGPEIRVVVIGGTLIILFTGGMFLRRRTAVSEIFHEEE
ncbi:MAG: anti-sigma factor family protein [Candidatus Aminicenantales bacterium]